MNKKYKTEHFFKLFAYLSCTIQGSVYGPDPSSSGVRLAWRTYLSTTIHKNINTSNSQFNMQDLNIIV